MSLVAFHRFLIATAIVFCAGYALWEVAGFLRSGTVTSLLLALLFGALAGLLAYYLRNLSRFLGLSNPPQGDEDSSGG